MDEAQVPAATAATSGEKQTLTTPNGTVVEIKGFVSGGDMEDMQRVFLTGMTFKVNPATGEVDQTAQSIPGTVTMDRTKKAIELLVLSVNGSTENVYEAVRALPVADYDAVVAKVNEISAPLAKTPSSS
jgi:hypothetical protein